MKKIMVVVMTVIMMMVFANAAFAAGKADDQPKKGVIATIGETASNGAKAVGNAAVATAEVAVGGVVMAGEAVGRAACGFGVFVRSTIAKGVMATGDGLNSLGAWIGGEKK